MFSKSVLDLGFFPQTGHKFMPNVVSVAGRSEHETMSLMSEGAFILLIDDHPAVREGLAMMLMRDHFCVCGERGIHAESIDRRGPRSKVF